MMVCRGIVGSSFPKRFLVGIPRATTIAATALDEPILIDVKEDKELAPSNMSIRLSS